MSARTWQSLGLLAAALGLVVVWVGDVDLPPVPPGIVISLVAAGLVAAVTAWWSALIGVLGATFLVVGFFAIATGNLTSDHGGLVVLRQSVQLLGLAVALVGGALTLARRG